MNIGIVTIATNKYLDYFIDLMESFNIIYPKKTQVEWFLFTDRTAEAVALQQRKLSFKLTVVPITGYKFPEASLFRYKIYTMHREVLDSDILIHLDADMLIKSRSFLDIVKEDSNTDSMTLIRHPGFYRPSGRRAITFYISQPLFVFKDLIRFLKFGSLGAWETAKNSSAFLPRKQRRVYFCGGIWFGPNKTFKIMCDELSGHIEEDLKKNVMAKWHDESHLNRYAAENPIQSLSPELCFDPTYPNLDGMREVIRAVDKNA